MESLIIALFMAIFRELWVKGKIAIKDIRQFLEIREYILSSQYLVNFITRCCYFRVFENDDTLRYPINLYLIFVEVRLLSNYPIMSLIALPVPANLDEQMILPVNPVTNLDFIEAANQIQYLIINGKKGAGKSSSLKLIFKECLMGREGSYIHELIPVLINADRFISPDINLLNLIEAEFLIANFPYAHEFTEEALNKGKLLIIIDGIDQIPEQENNINIKRQAITHIHDFIHMYRNNRFILSSCTQNRHIYNNRFSHFTEMQLADWNNYQIFSFIQNWSVINYWPVGAAENLWILLQESTNSQAQELFRIPLYLTLICIKYQSLHPPFANNRNFLNDLEFS
ncbi:NACHT domain-containing protein [Anabaena minutissima FACHB-250]|nr:NACHT domain-containing protein [Anabaena minutissima FACHB-250]